MSNVETKGTMVAYADWDAWRVIGKVKGNVALEHVYPENDHRLSSTVSETVLLGWFK